MVTLATQIGIGFELLMHSPLNAACRSPGGDEAHLNSVLKDFNEKHKTNVRFVGQDSCEGSSLTKCDMTSEAKLPEEIRVKNGL
jgi:hypothetical protein